MEGQTVTRTFAKWIPAIAIPAVVVATAVIIPVTADASPRLPEKSAQEVLEMIADSVDVSFSGTVEQTSDLGLPEIPSIGPASSDSAATTAVELLTGSHTARVFVLDEESVRVQVLDQLAQRDMIRNGNEAWLYDSASNETTHITVADDVKGVLDDAALKDAARQQASLEGVVLPDAASTPADLAKALLDAAEPSTTVTVGDTARVAGRAVYQIVLTPKTADTLVASATLSVDAETGLPLAATVMAVGQDDPAVSVAFSSIDFTAPDAGLFEFTPPAGGTVVEKPITAADVSALVDAGEASEKPALERPTVIGEGWSTIVGMPAMLTGTDAMGFGASSFQDMNVGDLKIDEFASMDIDEATAEKAAAEEEAALRLLEQVTTAVSGGRVLETSLVSVFFADDGRVFAGAVSAEKLVAAASQ